MGKEQERKEPTPFERNFNSLMGRIANELKKTSLGWVPVFSSEEPPLGLITLDKNRFWVRVINGQEEPVTGTANFVLRSFVILTDKDLYERSVVLSNEDKDERRDINRMADVIMSKNRKKLEAKLIKKMKVALILAQNPLLKRRKKDKKNK